VSECADTGLGELVVRKAAAELAGVVPEGRVAPAGSGPADVFVVKGIAGAEDIATGKTLGGADGEALRKALDALGWEQAYYAICAEQEDVSLSADALALAIEAVDPDLVLALDVVAARYVADALKIDALDLGESRIVAGRSVCAVDDLSASLTDEARKRRVWSQLKAISRDE